MKIQITASSLELAELMKNDPNLVEEELLAQGDRILALFENPHFISRVANFNELKRDLFCMVLEDLAMGAMTLKTSMVGVTFQKNQAKTFISPMGAPPQGNVMCCVNLRDASNVKSWRSGEASELADEDLQAAIYRIIVELSKVL